VRRLTGRLDGEHLIPRPSFFQLGKVRKARACGDLWHLIVYEDVEILVRQRQFVMGRACPGYLKDHELMLPYQ
jgi:hypothetical protein